MRCIKTCKKSQKKTVKNRKFAQQTKKQGVFYENKQTGKNDRYTEYTVIYSTGGGYPVKPIHLTRK